MIFLIKTYICLKRNIVMRFIISLFSLLVLFLNSKIAFAETTYLHCYSRENSGHKYEQSIKIDAVENRIYITTDGFTEFYDYTYTGNVLRYYMNFADGVVVQGFIDSITGNYSYEHIGKNGTNQISYFVDGKCTKKTKLF